MSIFTKMAHLPINALGAEIADYFKSSEHVTLVSSETGTGRTLLLPQYCAEALDWIEPIYVLLPSKVMAFNAAMNARNLLGDEADRVGYLCARRGGDQSITHENNRIIYTTPGFALATQIVMRARNFIIDEAHDTSPETVLTKSLLEYRRRTQDVLPRVLLMSATFDLDAEKAYWGPKTTKSFFVDGVVHPIHFVEGNLPWVECVEHLIDQGSTGIVIFTAGALELNMISAEIRREARYSSNRVLNTDDYELFSISGSSTYEERMKAFAPPKKSVKILLATRVAESSLSIPWWNGGASTGNGLRVYTANNVDMTEIYDISKSRIIQQAGRTNRFGPGTFVLNSPVGFAERPFLDKAAILTLPLDNMVYQMIRNHVTYYDLHFQKDEDPGIVMIDDTAHKLKKMRLIRDARSSKVPYQFEVTPEGDWGAQLCLTPAATAVAVQAKKMSCLEKALPLIAYVEVGSLIFRRFQPLGRIDFPSSFVFNQICVAEYALRQPIIARDTITHLNINYRKIKEYLNVIEQLEKTLHITTDRNVYNAEHDSFVGFDTHLTKILKTCLVMSSPEQFYKASPSGAYMGMQEVAYEHNHSLNNTWGDFRNIRAAFGRMQMIEPKNRRHATFPVISEVTGYTEEEKNFVLMNIDRASLSSFTGR